MLIKTVNTSSAAGRQSLAALQDRYQATDSTCRRKVAEIIAEVRELGDAALLEYTRKFDAADFRLDQLRATETEIEEAFGLVDPELLATLDLAIDRITTFHEHEKEESWIVTRADGIITGRLVNPVDSAGLYVPGGQGGKPRWSPRC